VVKDRGYFVCETMALANPLSVSSLDGPVVMFAEPSPKKSA